MEIVKVPRYYEEWCHNCQKDVEAIRVGKRIANRNYYGYVCSKCKTFIIFKEN